MKVRKAMSEVYLKRDKAIEAIEREFGDEASPDCVRAKEAVYSVELADVAPVIHAHWSKEMRFTEDFMGNRTYGYKCSVCGKLANRLQFCGNCGAKMDAVSPEPGFDDHTVSGLLED